MPDISSIGHGSVGPVDRSAQQSTRRDNAPPEKADSPPLRPGDSVELSDHARFLDTMRHMPATRHDRIEQVRQQISDGTFETEEKLETAIDRLLDELLNE